MDRLAPTVAPAEHLNIAGTASEPPRTQNADVLITPEKLEIARRMLEHKRGKIEVIETVFNVKRGGSDDYRSVSAAIDAMLREVQS